ncbi:MAG: tripartite tricarboxylate transporter substrate binding protein [Paralcaligenes sp.]
MFRHLIVTCVLAFGLCGAAYSAFPEHSIKLVVAWPPGGVTDTMGRFLAQKLGAELGQSVVVENKAGANGIIGTRMVANAKPDGYTLEMVTAETHAINPYLYKNLGYSPTKSFDALALLGTASFVLAERNNFAPKTATELIAYAKANPSKVNAGTYGVGSTSDLALAFFEQATKTEYTQVPYQGVAPTVNALIAGQVDIAFVNAINVVAFAKEGRVRVLGAASSLRHPLLPNVPTLEEQGLKNFRAGNWYGIVAPSGIQADVARRLEEAIKGIAHSTEFRNKLESIGVENTYKDARAFKTFLETENGRYAQIIKERKIVVSK